MVPIYLNKNKYAFHLVAPIHDTMFWNKTFITMNLIDLPEEVLLLIVKRLDLESLGNLYLTCRYMRNIVCMQCVVKIWKMSLNTLANIRTLNWNFFKDISGHLVELDMCGVQNVSIPILCSAMKRLKSLKTLNVSYTNVNLLDLLTIHQLCPTIKRVSVNLVFGKSDLIIISPDKILQCQDMFEHFEDIHFVGHRTNLLCSTLPIFLLKKSKLNMLKFTIIDCDHVIYQNEQCEKMVQFKYFKVFLLNWKGTDVYLNGMNAYPMFSLMEIKKFEFIIINMMNFNVYTVYVSQAFSTFFLENFGVHAECITELKKGLFGNVAIMFWDKASFSFDYSFYSNLAKKIKHFFPYNYIPGSDNLVPSKYTWFHTTPVFQDVHEHKSSKDEPMFKKRRVGPPCLTLDYDHILKEKKEIELSIAFQQDRVRNSVTLPTNSDYLRKLTFLSLSGDVLYNTEFFNVLFRSCEKLVTLNIEASMFTSCASALSRSVPLSRTLRNLRLVDRRIDIKTFFSSLSQCSTLENIHILDISTQSIDLPEYPFLVPLLEKCCQLYCIYMYLPMALSVRKKRLAMLNKMKVRLNKPHINIALLCMFDTIYSYTPFMAVFNINPIKDV